MESFDLDRRSIIRDGVDLSALLSNDMRDIHWSILDKLTPLRLMKLLHRNRLRMSPRSFLEHQAVDCKENSSYNSFVSVSRRLIGAFRACDATLSA